jgi:chitin synthase
MILSLILFKIKHIIFPPKKVIPTYAENLVYVIPCYNETPEELTRSLDSLVSQTNIDQHRRAAIIVVDGRVKGLGMEKTTSDSLFDDILTECKYRRVIKRAYIAWTRSWMDVEVQVGTYKGMPYYCMVKQQNQGKRDSLIAIRSFLYTFNVRHEDQLAIFSRSLFRDMYKWLSREAHISVVDVLVGMDADTVFDENCVYHLLEESRYPNTVG